MNSGAPHGPQTGWRVAAAVISLDVVAALGLDLVTGHLSWLDAGAVIALPPMTLFVVGGQPMLERVLPLFARRR